MRATFYIDHNHCRRVSYSRLLAELNASDSYTQYCYSADYYAVFKHLILSLILDEPVVLLDSDFSLQEVKGYSGVDNPEAFPSRKIAQLRLRNAEELYHRINSAKKWSVTLYTSGTTGIPKQVCHDFASLNRQVRVSSAHASDVWGFAYNPTHIAGLQVFFQAFLNQNTIVRLFGLPAAEIENSVLKEHISHLSATPTFYRLLEAERLKFPEVRRITSGGERLDVTTETKLRKIFPNAKFLNVYASTEAGTIFASESDIFTVTRKTQGSVKVVDGELYVSADLLAKSDDLKLVRGWYATGDIVETLSKTPLQFRFLSRKNEMINVGGNKVNPHEVEQALLAHKEIREARVYPKKNSLLGNIVCADVVSLKRSLSVPLIGKFLRKTLQEYKVPRIINMVPAISQTRTGKKSRL